MKLEKAFGRGAGAGAEGEEADCEGVGVPATAAGAASVEGGEGEDGSLASSSRGIGRARMAYLRSAHTTTARSSCRTPRWVPVASHDRPTTLEVGGVRDNVDAELLGVRTVPTERGLEASATTTVPFSKPYAANDISE
jgi:hypothetical protein